MSERLGFSGALARKFLQSELTPLLALIGILLGVFAVMVTPREEEPQIDVTFANVFIPFPGASAREVEQLVTTSAEQVLSEISGVKHIYSISRPGQAVLTVEFDVGQDRTKSIVRLYNALYSNQDWLPAGLGVGQPLVKPKGIDDVPIVTLTLWTDDETRGAADVQKVAHALEAELKRIPGTRDIYSIGGADPVVHVLLDPQRMAGSDVALDDLRRALQAGNVSTDAGTLTGGNREIPVRAGQFLIDPLEVGELVIGMREGAAVYLRDVADIRMGSDQPEHYVSFGVGPAASEKGITVTGEFPAVTLAVAKKPGSNAVSVSRKVIERLDSLRGVFIPDGIHITVTRDYGETANQKAQTLIGKLVFATIFVVLLVLFAMGWREAFIVGTAVVVTLAATLFASWAWGFTLNRVSLFALIFSIGILVDDAIVVVENIHRHMQMGKRSLLEAIPLAVDEVGGPTILATFTVIAALLPMAFVSGLMGPYMSPIPINASLGMVISLAVALVVTPWLAFQVLRRVKQTHLEDEDDGEVRLQTLFARLLNPFLRGRAGRGARWAMFGTVVLLIVLSIGLAAGQFVVLKMLPFDNKSEFQVVVDMPEGTALEQTSRVLNELGYYLSQLPEVTDYQIYAGTASPINFNGLIRQYSLRQGANVGDIQVNLVDKGLRDRNSHEIARSVREPLQDIGRRYSANVKIVEVPPGPPVLSPLVAEVYGFDYQRQIAVAGQVQGMFQQTADIVDVDTSVEAQAPRWIVRVDRQKAARLGVSQADITSTIAAVLQGEDMGYLHEANAKYPIPLRVELPVADKAHIGSLLDLKVRSINGALVPLADVVTLEESWREQPIYHKDLLPVVFVTADMAGRLDSPLYGMAELSDTLGALKLDNSETLKQTFTQVPDNPYRPSLKWDGEWQVTYETFRDMGIAYSVGLLLIYLLVVAQFRSYLVPLVIMAPIPLTIIGVMPGHALMGAQFTATSMIGMIALAGIIVRNSILLVDFINEELRGGISFEDAVVRAGVARAKPIILTGLAAVLGAFFILGDPIFRGLAIALIFGLFISTLLTLIVIPVMYYAIMRKRIKINTP